MIIAITGTPGTGKTEVSSELAKILREKFKMNFKVLHLNGAVLKNKLWSSIDEKRNSKNVDMAKLRKFILSETKRHPDIITESHLAHYFKADVVFVLRTQISELRRRMKRRKWGEAKIEENLDAERLNAILGEAWDIHGRKICVEIDTTTKTPENAAREMAGVISNR